MKENYEEIYIIGDVHGHYNELIAAIGGATIKVIDKISPNFWQTLGEKIL